MHAPKAKEGLKDPGSYSGNLVAARFVLRGGDMAAARFVLKKGHMAAARFVLRGGDNQKTLSMELSMVENLSGP